MQLSPPPFVPLFLTTTQSIPWGCWQSNQQKFWMLFLQKQFITWITYLLNPECDIASVTQNPKFLLLHGSLSLASPTDHQHSITRFRKPLLTKNDRWCATNPCIMHAPYDISRQWGYGSIRMCVHLANNQNNPQMGQSPIVQLKHWVVSHFGKETIMPSPSWSTMKGSMVKHVSVISLYKVGSHISIVD